MARRYSTSGTLVGAPVTVNFQVLTGFVPQYVEVHNLDSANTYTLILDPDGTTYAVPPGRVLKIPGQTPSMSINGTGDYAILASEGYGQLPTMDDSTLATGVGTAYLADEVTLHLDVPTHTFSVHDNGLVSAFVDKGIVQNPGFPAQGTIFFNAVAVAGDTTTVQVIGGANLTATWVAVVVTPATEILIGGTPTICATNLASWIILNHPQCNAGNIGTPYCEITVFDPTNIKAGDALVLGATGASQTIQNPAFQAAEARVATFTRQHTVTAFDVTRGVIYFYLNCNSIVGASFQHLDVTHAAKPTTVTISLGANNAALLNGGATPYIAGDIVTITALCVVS